MIRHVSTSWKTGDYGTTVWHHKLGCGHVVSRKRRVSDGKELDCTQCDEDERAQEELDALPDPVAPTPMSHAPEMAPEVEPDNEASILAWAQLTRAVIASGLQIDPEQIQIVAGDEGIQGGMIMLTPRDVESLVKKLTNS